MTDAPRRFVFHGSACALSGRVYRPLEIAGVIESPASSAISASGGLSRATLAKRKRIAPWLTVGSAETRAEGNFDNLKQAIEMTHHRVREDSLTTTTRVAAGIAGLEIKLADPHPDHEHDRPEHRRCHLTIAALKASLVSTNPTDAGGPPIRLGKETTVSGLAIDGYPVKVVLNHKLFQEASTYARFAEHARGSRSPAADGEAFFANVPASGGTIETTIVSELRWAKRRHPTATIEKHVITVPNFGKIHVGEMLISAEARRLTILRLVFGSHTGFHVSFGDVHTDGSWYPP